MGHSKTVGAAEPSIGSARTDEAESAEGLLPADSREIAERRISPPASGGEEPSAPSAAPELPPELVPGQPTELSVSGDRTLRVTHAPAGQRRAIVYLHGMCGNSKGADPWSHLATRYGSLVVLRANVPCEDRPGYKWPTDVEAIQRRIDVALERVRQTRAGQLDLEQIALFGYSQGANRAEKLAGAYPERYPWVVLGGTPTVAVPERLLSTRAVAFLGGELEDTSHMVEGAHLLSDLGHPSRFFLLPRVHHGSYGPQGPEVVSSALEFVFAR